MTRYCKHCGKPEEDHCIFEPIEIPSGCVCDPSDWQFEIPEVCSMFEGCKNDLCHNCEHLFECHENKPNGFCADCKYKSKESEEVFCKEIYDCLNEKSVFYGENICNECCCINFEREEK